MSYFCDVCGRRRRFFSGGPTCRRCITWSWRVLAGLSAVVLALSMWSCGSPAAAQTGPEPLELKLIGETECAPGWVQVGEEERGVSVYYRTQAGAVFPNWITWDRFVSHFIGKDPVLLENVSLQTRITCRWSPMGGDAA